MIGSRWLGLIVLIVAYFLCRRSLRAALISFALYLVTIEIFFNLHYVHLYYAYANAIFVVVALGIVLGAMVGLPGRKAWAGVVLLAAMLATCGIRYMREYYDLQHTNALSRWQTAALIDRTTTPNDVILIVGLLGSAEFPYQSHRRAVMSPSIPSTTSGVELAIRNQGPNRIAAIVVCGKGRGDTGLPGLLGELSMPASTGMHAEDCDVYERVGTQTDGKTSTTD
jgi:hypothetical protein